jgi:hypothetical protein
VERGAVRAQGGREGRLRGSYSSTHTIYMLLPHTDTNILSLPLYPSLSLLTQAPGVESKAGRCLMHSFLLLLLHSFMLFYMNSFVLFYMNSFMLLLMYSIVLLLMYSIVLLLMDLFMT